MAVLADEVRQFMMQFAAGIATGCLEEDAAATRDARFAELAARQARFVFQVAYAVLRNREDAEDVVQEAFLKLYRSGAWERMHEERAYLARATWRLAVGRMPKRRSEELDRNAASQDADPEQAAITSDWNETIHRMMDALPEELRQVLALSAIAGLGSREVGEIMGISMGTVRTRLMRARRLLKSKLTAVRGGHGGT